MPSVPESIGKYTIVEQIGSGGMGLVYKAEHPTLERFVILKKLNISTDAVMRERFRREAQIMIDFRTDYVVDVYDHFRHGSSDYIVLEYIDGVSLDEILARERYLPSDLALFIMRDVFRGLDYVHRKGVVHRDVKPGNVVVGRDGTVKLLDFGIASRGGELGDGLTREGMTLGTVAYIAPEQIERSRDVDSRADIYSAGATLYEMLTGRKAFAGGFNPETVHRIQRGRYRPPRRVNPRVSRPAARIVRRCMQRSTRRRFQRAADVVRVLDDSFRQSGDAGLRERLASLASGSPAGTGRKRSSAARWVRPAVAVLVVLIAAAAAGWSTGDLQRALLGRTHTLARLEVRLRKSGRAVDEHRIAIELFQDAGDESVPVMPRVPFLRQEPALETPDYLVVRSRLLTLPAGRYTAVFTVEDAVVREDLVLPSLAEAGDVQSISTRWDPVPPVAVALDVSAFDAALGYPLSEARVETRFDGRWVEIRRRGAGWEIPAPMRPRPFGAGDRFEEGDIPFATYAPLGRLVTFVPGRPIELRIGYSGYDSENVELVTEQTTRTVRVRVGLQPRSAADRQIRPVPEANP